MSSDQVSISARFRTHNILKEDEADSLGSGAYGTVYRALCDGLLCAAKVMHPALVGRGASKYEHRLPWKRFEAECRILNALRHPNIVQYLETWLNPETGQSVLLMELMDESLTQFLDRCKTNLPFHTEVNICQDIALALSFLHSNGITHRDLSSNNVLMLGDRRAKVTDFGMAKIFFHKNHSLTNVPGTRVYMPPEAFMNKPDYRKGIDCFTYGVLTLQVITQAYPQPVDELVSITRGSEEFYKKVPELERRQGQIDLAPSNHLLLPITMDCLKDKENERPTADDISSTVSSLVHTSEYCKSKAKSNPARIAQEKDREIAGIVEKSKRDMLQLQQECARRVDKLEKKCEKAMKDLQFLMHDHNHVVGKLKEKFALRLKAVEEEKEEAKLDRLERDELIQGLRQQVMELEKKSTTPLTYSSEESDRSAPSTPTTKFSLTWRLRENPAMKPMYREDSECVMCNDTLYVRPASKYRKVYAYHPTQDMWEEMPACPHDNATLARINNTVLALGGRTKKMDYLNSIYFLTRESSKYRWKETDFHLPTKRCSVMAVNTDQSLIVAGGQGEESSLRKVEVMDTATRTWSVAADLPEALTHSSATLCDGQLFFLGGRTGYNMVDSSIVFKCSIQDLLQSCQRIGQKIRSLELPVNTWRKIKGPPVTRSVCVTAQGHMLALGGIGGDGKATSLVYRYDTKGWSLVGHMVMPRSCSFAISHAGGNVLVVGGVTNLGRTDTMETATLNV